SYLGHSIEIQTQYASRFVQQNNSLQTQIRHKIACLDFLISEYSNIGWTHSVASESHSDVSFFVAGHSIGSHMMLELLKQRPEVDIRLAMALFPTIERMISTPHGQIIQYITSD
ncbi:hypothetical protein HK096_005903, partial [Nowakowskiella sp. JEL0078]